MNTKFENSLSNSLKSSLIAGRKANFVCSLENSLYENMEVHLKSKLYIGLYVGLYRSGFGNPMLFLMTLISTSEAHSQGQSDRDSVSSTFVVEPKVIST